MKKMTKLVSLLMVLVMAVAMLQGCGDDKDKDDKKTTTTTAAATQSEVATTTSEPAAASVYDSIEDGAVLTVWEAQGADGNFLKESARLFQEKYGVEVNYEEVGHTDSVKKITLDGPAGVGADVFAIPHDHIGEAVTNGLIVENDVAGYYEQMSAVGKKAGSYGGKTYGFPLQFETYALFYNKALVQTPPTTWDEIIEFAKTYNDVANNKFACIWDTDDSYYCFAFLNAGPLFGEDGTNKDLMLTDTPAAATSMKYYQKLRAEVLPIAAADATGDALNAGFTEGKIAMCITGPWSIESFVNAGLDFGVVPFPQIVAGQDPMTFSGVRLLVVSAYSKYPNAAKAFAYFTTTEQSGLRAEMCPGGVPVCNSAEANEYQKAFAACGEYAIPMPAIPEMSAYWNVMGGIFAKIWDGEDVDATLAAATTSLKENMKK